MNKRKLRLDKYGISNKRYKELCGFCEQYPEWLEELKSNTDTVKSSSVSSMPASSSGSGDPTSALARRRAELRKRCELIEQTAIQANADLYQYIIRSVCYEEPVRYLQTIKGMACSTAAFYDARRYFFIFWTKVRKCEKKRTYFRDIMILSQNEKAYDRSADFEYSLPVLLLCRKGSESRGQFYELSALHGCI